MASATYTFEVFGKDHEHIAINVREELQKYVGTEEKSVIDHINYETEVKKTEENVYRASVIARVKL
jgi:hypothetical protein